MAATCSGRLALGEDDFGHAVAQGAVVVHLGEPEVFKRHVPHAPHGYVDIYRAGAYLFEERTHLVLVHDARISESLASAGLRRTCWGLEQGDERA